MVNVLRLIASIILMGVGFLILFLSVIFGVTLGYGYSTPVMGGVIGLLGVSLGVVGLLLLIDAIKSDWEEAVILSKGIKFQLKISEYQ